ncbi:hypothetical protein [Spirosoma lituiforme]
MIQFDLFNSSTPTNGSYPYSIKVPVYVSDIKSASDLFDTIDYNYLVKSIIRTIDEYNQSSKEIKYAKKKKTYERVVKGIDYEETIIGDRPALLIKTTAYNTNYIDGFYEERNKVALTKDSKIGSDNNFMLMYPHISGLNQVQYKYYWIILLYEDPNKVFNELASTAKAVLNKVLNIKIENIKLKKVINDITIKKVAPELIIRLVTVDHDVDNEQPELKRYLIEAKNKIVIERRYKNLPAEETISLLENRQDTRKKFQNIKRVIFGNQEYRYTQSSEGELNQRIKETVEEIYNSEIPISEKDLQDNLYNHTFVIDKFKQVLTEYWTENEG